jgi:hypothetical protein
MKRPAANHGRSNTPLRQRRIGQSPRPECPVRRRPAFCCPPARGPGAPRPGAPGAPGAGAPGAGTPSPVVWRCASGLARRCPPVAARTDLGESLNWSLRRYVRASSLRVWLVRHGRATGGAADRHGRLREAGGRPGGRPGGAGASRPPAPRERAVSRPRPAGTAPRKPLYRNGQMEHYAQLVAGLRGGVRCAAGIAPRENANPRDQVLATLGSKTDVQSNIFGFVTT